MCLRAWRNWQTRKTKDLVENYLRGSSNLLTRITKVVGRLSGCFLYEINSFLVALNKLLENTEKILYTVFAS